MNGAAFTTPRTNSNARSQRRHCIQLFAPLGAVEPSDFLVDLLGKFAQQKKPIPAQLALARLLAKKPRRSFRSRAQASCIALKKASERRTSNLHLKISVPSKVPPQTLRSKGLGIRNGLCR
jgi:hypothetical protein